MKEIILTGKSNKYRLQTGTESALIKPVGKLSSVYKGEIIGSEKHVVIKKLASHAMGDTELETQFNHEALVSIEHNGIPKILDFIEQDGQVYLVKEYISGINLKRFAQTKVLRRKDALLFYTKCIILVLEILEKVHEEGYVHTDIRPGNIIIHYDSEGQINFHDPKVSLIDFGLSKFPNEKYTFFKHQPFALIYSSPEQVLKFSELVNHYSDIYSVGLTLYTLISSKRFKLLFNEESIMNMQISNPIKYDLKIPYELFNIIRKATNKKVLMWPPGRYSEEVLEKILKQGQVKRYKSAKGFKEDLIDFTLKYEKVRKNSLLTKKISAK